MDRSRERPHMGLIYIVMCSRRGWCGWHFNHDRFGAKWGCRCRRITYPSQHQCRARYMIFDGFMILKPICICFKRVYVLWKGALVVFGVVLAQRCQRRFRPARVVLKESYYPQTRLVYETDLYYIDLEHVFDFLNVQPGRFPFTFSFTKHVISLIPSFPLFLG